MIVRGATINPLDETFEAFFTPGVIRSFDAI